MLTYDAALRLFDAGEFGALAKTSVEMTAATPLSLRLLVAHALVRSGDARRALEWVAPGQDRPSPLLLQARAQVVTGLALRAQGFSADASRHLQAAVRTAENVDDTSEL